jgi:hypothetical protein
MKTKLQARNGHSGGNGSSQQDRFGYKAKQQDIAKRRRAERQLASPYALPILHRNNELRWLAELLEYGFQHVPCKARNVGSAQCGDNEVLGGWQADREVYGPAIAWRIRVGIGGTATVILPRVDVSVS